MSEGFVRETKRVRWVCTLLDCHRSQVYRLMDVGDLEWMPFGRRGRRIFLDSVLAYQARRNGSPAQPVVESKKHRVQNPGFKTAMESLVNEGIV